MLIAAYGSLRPGHYNFSPDEMLSLGEDRIKGYDMYNLGYYPCVYPGDGTIVVDVIEVGAETKKQIDLMEFGAGYHEETVITRFGEAALYVYNRKPTNLVPSGDWNERPLLKSDS